MSDHDAGRNGKHSRLEELETMVRDGRIDTIVVAFTDMQGRLMGKRGPPGCRPQTARRSARSH